MFDDETDQPRATDRRWVPAVAVLLLVPFVFAFAGAGTVLRGGGVGLVAVGAFVLVLAAGYVVARWWLRRRLDPGYGSAWSDRP